MHEHGMELGELAWFIGWVAAVTLLFVAAIGLPLNTRRGGLAGLVYAGMAVAAGFGVWILANAALLLNDLHIDVTRVNVYTPSAGAMAVADKLKVPVRVTYFVRSEDPIGKRTGDILEVMGRRNPLLSVTVVDPDRKPEIARREGIRLYNAAVIEAAGRRVLIQGTDEAEIAIGIQRVLRERTINICFLEGHGEFAMDGFEFHSHLEGVTDHSHGEASSLVVETAGHGVGRLSRALEAQGYVARKFVLATSGRVPGDCALVVVANPRTTFLPGESAALSDYLTGGGSALFMLDLGFELEPGLAQLMSDLGVALTQEVVVDPLSHYQSDPEMVAVTGYGEHSITRTVSLTFFPGVRPLAAAEPKAGVSTTPLIMSSRDSYTRRVKPAEARVVDAAGAAAGGDVTPAPAAADVHPRTLAVAAEGVLGDTGKPFRAMVIGDGDFASNSFLPYMANSDLAVAAVRWLVREDRGAVVKTRIPVPATIVLTGGQARWIFLLLVVILPLTIAGMGAVVWWRRR